MQFFISHIKDKEKAEKIWEVAKQFAESQGFKVTNRRIESISYVHDGKLMEAVVGEKGIRQNEAVIVILESDICYLVCTYSRGIRRGIPMLVGKWEIETITDFDSK